MSAMKHSVITEVEKEPNEELRGRLSHIGRVNRVKTHEILL